MKKITAALCAFLFATAGISQEMDLSVDKIPDSLKKNASIVVRYEKEVFEVSAVDRAVYSIHEIATVLNESGRGKLQFGFESHKFVKLGDLDIKVYDANGKQINRYKKKDLSTYNIGEGLIDDATRVYLSIAAPAYPLTVEFKFDIIYKGIISYPSYTFSRPSVSVMESSFTAVIPKELGLRFRPKNTSITPAKTDDGKSQTFVWGVKNQPAIFYEDGAVSSGQGYPHIVLAPNKFKIDDYAGDMTTWKNYGVWYASVVAGTDKMSDARKAFYQNLVKDATTDVEKVKIIYTYLQKNFRYVLISLGIGGQRPLPADFTDEKKYGDCKGLSNYVHTVLKALGIKSYLALIRSEENDPGMDEDFPNDRFNHVVLYVPQGKEGIWLECTSKTAAFGALSSSTENKNAVLITENGGVLINTPKSTALANTFSMRTAIQLDATGSGDCASYIAATGAYRDEMQHFLAESKKDDQKSYLIKRIGFKQPDAMEISGNLTAPGYSTDIALSIEKVSEFIAGSKMFLAPRIYKFWTYKLPETEKRLRDFYFEVPFTKTDTTIYKIPEGYAIDMLPAGKKFECESAQYSSSYTYNDTEKAIYSITYLQLKEHKIAPAKYQDVKLFFDKVLKEETQRIVIKKS
jgi:hypothetical protein